MSENLYFDNSELRARIRNQYGTTRTFAKAVHISPKTLEKRLDGFNGSNWFLSEMEKICNVLQLNHDEMNRLFFTETNERGGKIEHITAIAEKLTDEELSGLIAFMDEYMTERGQILVAENGT